MLKNLSSKCQKEIDSRISTGKAVSTTRNHSVLSQSEVVGFPSMMSFIEGFKGSLLLQLWKTRLQRCEIASIGYRPSITKYVEVDLINNFWS